MTVKSKDEGSSQSMSRKTALTVAAALGVVAFFMFLGNAKRVERKWTQIVGEKTDVVVAASDIFPGGEIEPKQVRLEKRLAIAVQPGALTVLEDVVNRAAQIPILAGQQVLESMLHREGGRLSLRVGRDSNRRAIALTMDGEGVLAGLMKPGDVVDIVGVFEAAATEGVDAQPRNHAMILAQAVTVLAVDGNMSELAVTAGSGARSGMGSTFESSVSRAKSSALVTFDVDAEQAWQLSLAARVAHIRCVLRHRSNADRYDYRPVIGLFPRIDAKEVFQAGGVSILNMKQPDAEVQ